MAIDPREMEQFSDRLASILGKMQSVMDAEGGGADMLGAFGNYLESVDRKLNLRLPAPDSAGGGQMTVGGGGGRFYPPALIPDATAADVPTLEEGDCCDHIIDIMREMLGVLRGIEAKAEGIGGGPPGPGPTPTPTPKSRMDWRSLQANLAQTMVSQRFGHQIGGALGMVGDAIGGSSSHPAAQVASRAFQFGKALAESVERLRDWSNILHDANMRFAEFSGAMSVVAAEQRIRDIRLSQERGDRRAGSAREVAEAKSQLDRTLAPYEDAFSGISSKINQVLTLGFNKIMEDFGKMTGLDKTLKGSDANKYTAKQDLIDAGAHSWAKNWQRPNRFAQPGSDPRFVE